MGRKYLVCVQGHQLAQPINQRFSSSRDIFSSKNIKNKIILWSTSTFTSDCQEHGAIRIYFSNNWCYRLLFHAKYYLDVVFNISTELLSWNILCLNKKAVQLCNIFKRKCWGHLNAGTLVGGSYVKLIGGMRKEHLCLGFNCSLFSSNKPLLEKKNEMQIQPGHVKSQWKCSSSSW